MIALIHAFELRRRNREQEREPHRGARDGARLAEQREDSGADHRADAEEGRAADGHVNRAIDMSTGTLTEHDGITARPGPQADERLIQRALRDLADE